MTLLCELAQKYGTDKAGGGYTTFYHSLLGTNRASVRRVLEIGIGTPEAMKHVPGYKPGASLRMWRDYFPNALIVGMDIEPAVMFAEDRIVTVEADQRDTDFLSAVTSGARFDLIVDDGLHTSDSQVNTAHALVPAVAPGGLYIIEDVGCPHLVSSLLKFPHYAVMTRGGRGDQCIVIPC